MIELIEAGGAPDIIRVKDIKQVKVGEDDSGKCFVDAEGELVLTKGDQKEWDFRLKGDPIKKPHLAHLILNPLAELGHSVGDYFFDIKKRAWINALNYKVPRAASGKGLESYTEDLAVGFMEVDKRGNITMEDGNEEGDVKFSGRLLDPTTWEIRYLEVSPDDTSMLRWIYSTWGENGKYEWVSKIGGPKRRKEKSGPPPGSFKDQMLWAIGPGSRVRF